MTHPQWRRSTLATAIAASVATLCFAPSAQAMKFDTNNPDLKLRWDNTFKYSAGFRLKDRSDLLVNDANYDDGDRNFDKGLISNRIDWLTEFDVRYKNIGARLSGAAWYDSVYNQSNDNDSPFTNNGTRQDNDEFPDETRKLHGRNAELLDAFVFGNFDLGSLRTNLRLGQHSLVYGETLFFGANGIADAQGPIDLVRLLTVPSSQFKEVLRPVPQVSGTLQIAPGLSLGAYYQFRWEETKLPGVGSYMSNIDWAGDGTQSLIAGPGTLWNKADDIDPKNSGQGGMQLRWSPEGSDFEYGLYAARYHAKTPSSFYFDPVGQTIRTVYGQGIRTFGASATTSIGQLNLAAEASVRHNAPLNGDPQVVLYALGGTGDNDRDIRYPVGKTAHANLSGIYVLQPNALWEGGSFLFELAWNRVLSVTKNKAALDPNTTRDAWGGRMIFSPAYFQVLPGLDIEVPIGLGYNFAGRSGAIANFNGGASYGGDFSLGLNGTYQNTWKFGVSYVRFIGDEFSFVTPQNSAGPVLSFKQTRKDRDFISFNIQRTF
ncbi:DUF1302 domain-containing protein [Denitromonas iodatirespirans]|uniref:DUF1302 domain-containing protein n=1 Tax=Denitromonas iodatirespirans TaxID=2795389 RepID=A0A944H9Z2_DENI1|nr:DUF1302 domain-containing protein [Denitromonas iodatirespirans]MBT0962950.1 DUF1302 domain-containing protein [Denitromonas iodatirespirans]